MWHSKLKQIGDKSHNNKTMIASKAGNYCIQSKETKGKLRNYSVYYYKSNPCLALQYV